MGCDRDPCVQIENTWDCDHDANPHDCPDAIVLYIPVLDGFSLSVRDGPGCSANSGIPIEHCSWCARRLPGSRREEYFTRLEQLGLDLFDELPEELRRDRWWRKASRQRTGEQRPSRDASTLCRS
jgi:hypothetical protein